jgi:cytidylate kinase
MTVIALARQVGSGGQAVASGLAERLGYRVIGRKEIRAEAARQGLALPESFERFATEDRAETGFNHYLSYGELEFDMALRGGPNTEGNQSGSPFLAEMTANSHEILLTLQVLIYQIAATNDVILVGAGAQILLAGFPGVLRVKIIAPAELRVERMMEAYGLTEAEARAAVRGSDREQIDYNRIIFGEDWHNPELWDLVINSELLTVGQIVDLISTQLTSPTTEANQTLTKSLSAAAAVNRELLASSEAGQAYASAVPTAEGIAIRGDVPNSEIHAKVMQIAAAAASGIYFVDSLSESLMS